MSRSYRVSQFGDSYGSSHRKWAKRQAAKAVRRYRGISDGKMYRKLFNPWNITDCKYLLNKDDKQYLKYSRK